jgi:hypothetical protein
LPITVGILAGAVLGWKGEWWLAVPVFIVGTGAGFVIHEFTPLVKR